MIRRAAYPQEALKAEDFLGWNDRDGKRGRWRDDLECQVQRFQAPVVGVGWAWRGVVTKECRQPPGAKNPEHSPEGRGYRNLNSSHNLLSLEMDSNLRSTSLRIVPQLTLLVSKQGRGSN